MIQLRGFSTLSARKVSQLKRQAIRTGSASLQCQQRFHMAPRPEAQAMIGTLAANNSSTSPSSFPFFYASRGLSSANYHLQQPQHRSISSATTPKTAPASAAASASAVKFRSWPQPKVTCRGDYREEAWLESYIGGPLYEHQANLPRLPIPSVEETLGKLVPTAVPLAKSPAERENFLRAVEAFPSQSAVLQDRLKARAQEYHDSSWLQHWWNTWGYLQVRDPITVNVSYFFHLSDDPKAGSNVARAASLLQAAALFRQGVCSGNMPAERIGRGDKLKMLDSTAFKYMFHATRIPVLNEDVCEIHDPSLYRHVLVLRHGQFYVMDFCNEQTGQPFSLEKLEQGLHEIVQRAADAKKNGQLQPELGWLTSSNRDDWATARQDLISKVPGAQKALDLLESAAFCICLDDLSPVAKSECAEEFWHGSSEGKNRWMDKSVQIVVTNNGKAAVVGEHSMMDGMPVVGLADKCTKITYGTCTDAVDSGTAGCNVRSVFEGLDLNVMVPHVQKAKQDFEDLTGGHKVDVQSFQGYGSDFIKKAGYSPDAFVQVAMQLATYRLWGQQAGTYEATQVRPFLHGRTETTRAVSTQSAEFIRLMGARPAQDDHIESIRKEKLRSLQEAVTAHVKYMGQAAQAKGVDRHLLGLSLVVQDGETAPDLYNDPVYIRSKRWCVSTSHLTHPKFDGWGFGEVVPDGVGIAYSIHPRHCVFNVAALKEHEWTNKLCQLLEDSLLEMRTLVEMDQPVPSSKL